MANNDRKNADSPTFCGWLGLYFCYRYLPPTVAGRQLLKNKIIDYE